MKDKFFYGEAKNKSVVFVEHFTTSLLIVSETENWGLNLAYEREAVSTVKTGVDMSSMPPPKKSKAIRVWRSLRCR